ncbi:MAG TPA: glycerophosphodiester phosphodiesterase [Pseudonocardiaceae bacterium]|nr:glycerophosphodiester phosphodiesterase [Pseudonocardiaceae bacterium]
MALPQHPYLDGPFPRAFAHRGWHLGELAGMENSLAAFRRAVREGYRYLETDVQATRDGVVVVLHDTTLDRTTDGSGAIGQLDWAAARTARVGGREPVCRLADLLEELPRALLNIDVKSDAAVAPVLDLLRRTRGWDRVCLASFSEARLQRIRKVAGPRLLTSMGSASVAALRLRSVLPWWPIGPPVRGGLAQLPVRRHGIRLVDRALLHYAHRQGLEVHVWTVDRAEEMAALLDLGVDGLVTDRPDELRAVLRARGAWPEADVATP